MANPDIYGFKNGLYCLSLKTFFFFEPSADQKYAGDLTCNLEPIKRYDVEFDPSGTVPLADKFLGFFPDEISEVDRAFILTLLSTHLMKKEEDTQILTFTNGKSKLGDVTAAIIKRPPSRTHASDAVTDEK